MTAPPTVRAVLVGNSGSGKTTRAWNMYLAKFPRLVVIDQTGEWEDRCDATAETLADLVAAIRQLAPRGKWIICAQLDEDDLPALVAWMIPLPNVQRSPILAVGGAALFLDEVDLFAPTGAAPKHIRTLYRRSRHVGLSVISCTQRPANVSREVTAQSTHLVAHYLSEPRDRDYTADVMRFSRQATEDWVAWCRRHPHGAVWKDLQTGKVLYLPDRGSPIADPNLRTRQLPLPKMNGDGDGDADVRKVPPVDRQADQTSARQGHRPDEHSTPEPAPSQQRRA